MSTGSIKTYLLKSSAVTPYDKNESHMSSPEKSLLIKGPKNREIERLKKVTQDIGIEMPFLKP